ncbi:cytochrome P450 [Duganella sp. FT80W]|uniref:Cytochrome P450 n=1 Tax=Duganella guangzhouensis TaxID=2666084 RepID=A0A6I2LA80_9BURK|nr:cytochrome P450 [Duganella guangzhouensis]MRW94047.1 cytochrome P450 [Duganella guangzhouensis]
MEKNTIELTPGMAPLRSIAELPGPQGRPLFGNIRDIRAQPFHQVMERWGREYGPLYRFRIMRRTMLATADRDLIATMLRDRPDLIRRSTRSADMLNEVGTRGLFTAEGEEWRRQRKLVMRALTPEVIHNFFPTLTAMTERLRLRWERALAAGQPVDLLRDLKAYTLDVTIGLAMGQDINTLELEEHPLQRDIEFLFKLVAKRLTSPFAYWRVPVLRRAQDHEAIAASARIQQAIFGFIAEARKRIAQNPALRAKPSNMLEALIVARDEPDSGFSDAEVVGNAITMVFAGEDTTSNTMAWLIDFLADYPQAAARMSEEAQQVLGARAVLDDYHQLDQLKYVDAATREAMRLKPVAPFMAAETTQDVTLGDLAVPEGTVIFLLLRHASERDAEWSQPDQFLPERWLDGAHGPGDDPGRKVFPFGAGPRFCPGRYLAMAEIKMVMAMLARQFRLERVPGAAPARECFTFTMTPDVLPVRLVQS